MAKTVYALLVGIDQYPPQIPTLSGCVNDIQGIQDFLKGRAAQDFELKPLVLTDQNATRQAVIDGFQKHLAQAKVGDVAFFYYAGHGSQEQAPEEFWPLEPDHLNETLVCWDSRNPSSFDLADKELAKLIADLGSTQAHVLIGLDCCHSGSGTRALGMGSLATRRAPTDTRKRPIESYLVSPTQAAGFAATRSTVPSGWFNAQSSYILMAACRPEQTAKEARFEGKAHGAFTAALLEALQQSGRLSYRDLFKRVENEVKNNPTISDQNPQLEPATELLDQPFLGGAIPERQPYYTLSNEKASGWVIDGGAIHGLRQGSGSETTELAVFAVDSDPAPWQIKNALGTARIIQVLPDKSLVELQWKQGPPDPAQTYQATVTSGPLPKLRVAFEGDGGALDLVRSRLKTINAGQPSLLAQEVGENPDLRLLASKSAYWLTKPGSERPLTNELNGFTADNAEKVARRLEHISRWQTTLKLQNPGSGLEGKVKLEVYRVTGPPTTRDPSSAPKELIQDADVRLDYQLQSDSWKQPGIKIRVINNSPQTVWCGLLGLTESFEIANLWPESNGVELKSGQEVWVRGGATVFLNIPDNLYALGVTERQDVIKLIVATSDFAADLYTQPPLDSPSRAQVTRAMPRNALERLAQRVQTRDFGGTPDNLADWWADAITLTTVRPQASSPVTSDTAATAGPVTLKVGAGSSFKAKAALSSVAQASRSTEGFSLPPMLRDLPDVVESLRFSEARANTPALEVFELTEIQNPQAITPDNPLILQIPHNLAANEQIIPMAVYRDDEGEYYLPIGYAKPPSTRAVGGGSEIVIPNLPNVPDPTRTRSLLSSLKMMFLKIAGDKLGLAVQNQQLSVIQVAPDGQTNYLSDPALVRQLVTNLQPGDKILLYVHGILGQTKDMVGSVVVTPSGASEPISQHYKLILGYDYENLNTSIKDSAKRLGQALEAIGLGAGHNKELHLVAHSMGGLVSRWFIEHEGGDQVVGQLVMLGTPNAGSPWSNAQEWLTNLLTLAVNGLASGGWKAAILGGGVGILNAVGKVDTTLEQMKPGSQFLQDLGTAPSSVPYVFVAGDYKLAPPKADRKLFNKIWDGLLGASSARLFGGKPNDLAASVESVLAPAPDPKPQAVGSDHFSYFVPNIGLGSLASALELPLAQAEDKKKSTPEALMDTPQTDSTPNDAVAATPATPQPQPQSNTAPITRQPKSPPSDPVVASPVVVPPIQVAQVPANVGVSSAISQAIFNSGGSMQSSPRVWPPELTIQAWKEGVAAVIGVIIVLFTLLIAWNTFSQTDSTKLANAKDLLQIMLSLLGVILGYYFGRIPAEARAAQAQEQANTATAKAAQTSAQAEAAADQLEQVINQPTQVSRELGAASPLNDQLKDIRDKLRGIARTGR